MKTRFARFRSFSHKALSSIVGGSYKCLCKLHICSPRIIVQVDGGICSQMHQFLLGQVFAERGEMVRYDLSWFRVNGWDVDHQFTRDYELELMFPDIRVARACSFETFFYRMFLLYSSNDHKFPDITNTVSFAPRYLGGYYEEDDQLFSLFFSKLFCNQRICNLPFSIAKDASGRKTCAIHVRRGDLAKGDNPYYGGVPDEYFLHAIAYVENKSPNTKFYFFSDEIDYVEDAIVPGLSIDFVLMKGPRKAYEDLLLIAECDYIVASQGSFGKYAAMLNEDSCLILHNDRYAKPWLARKKNTITI